MFGFVKFVIRNRAYTVSKVRHAYRVRKAMWEYAKAHPQCEWCGRERDVDVHHVIPISVAPDLAGAEANMISLCADKCYLYVGHNGDYRSRYVENVKLLCNQRKVVRSGRA